MIRTASSLRLAAIAAALLAAAATRAPAQSVLLQFHPRVGDTLHTRLEQQVEMTGTMRVGLVDSTTTVVTTLRARTHSVVEQSDGTGIVLVSVTDSLDVRSTGGRAGHGGPRRRARSSGAVEGQRVRLRISTDGSAAVLDASGLAPEVQAFLGQMPATLPRSPVSVGDAWTRRMRTPPVAGYNNGGDISVTFRLDSLTRERSLAYISMHGTVSRSETPVGTGGLVRVVGGGALAGTIVIDRRRGWLSEARTTLAVRSTLMPPLQSGASSMRFQMRVQEWLRTVDSR